MVISYWSTSSTCHTIHAKFRGQLIRRQNNTNEIQTGLPQTQTEFIRDHQWHRHSGTANKIITVAVVFQSYDLPLLIVDSVPSLLALTINNTNGTHPWSSMTHTLRKSQQSRYKPNNTVTIVKNDNNCVLILITTCRLNMIWIKYWTEYFYSTLMIKLVLRNV
jgi:hypothetical protein